MNGFILLVPALTFGQVDAAWATPDNVDREWVLRIDPQVLDWLRDGRYKEVASNIDPSEPAAKKLRIRFANTARQGNLNVTPLNSAGTVELSSRWQMATDPDTRQQVPELIVEITPQLIATLKTGQFEIAETIPAEAGSVRQFRLVVVEPPPGSAAATQTNRQPAPLPQNQTAAAPGTGLQQQPAGVTNPPFTPRPNNQPNAPLNLNPPPGSVNVATNPQGLAGTQGNQFQPVQPATNYQANLPRTPVGTNPNYNPNAPYGTNAQANTSFPYGGQPGTQNPNYGGQPGQAPYGQPPANQPYGSGGNPYQTQQPPYNNQQNWAAQQNRMPNPYAANNGMNPAYQNAYRPNNQQLAQLPNQSNGANAGQTQPPATQTQPPANQQAPLDRNRGGERDSFVNRPDYDRDDVQKVSREGVDERSNSRNTASSDFFWLMIFLFLSIGFNVYLVWVAWQTYWKYRDLVSDTRAPRTTGAESY